jgi:kumamolisin
VAGIRQVEQSFKDAAMLGITVCVAAGDDGSGDGYQDGHAHADFPACSEYVLAVGGTTIPSKTASSDIVWFEHNGVRPKGGSTGGGVSAVIPRPAWQSGITIKSVNPRALVGRCIPDLGANADWDVSPYLLVVDGGAQPNGGTSAASPLVASLVALLNAKLGKRLGYLTPRLYQAVAGGSGQTVGEAGCTDVTTGNNTTAHAGGYSAGKGYDAVSGWGTPNGLNMLAALSEPVVAAHTMSATSGAIKS